MHEQERAEHWKQMWECERACVELQKRLRWNQKKVLCNIL